MPCAMVKLTDIPEMNYLAKNGEGEVSEIVLKGYRLPVAPTHTRREREREWKRAIITNHFAVYAHRRQPIVIGP